MTARHIDGVRVIVGPRVRGNLYGGSLFQTPDDIDAHGYGTAGRDLVTAVNNHPPRQPMLLTRPEALVLAELVDYMLDASRDDRDYATIAAARRLLAALDAQGVVLS